MAAVKLRTDGLQEGRGGLLGLRGTCSPIQDIFLPIPQMQNIDFESLFGNIHMVISFSKQLLSTLEASDAIGMDSTINFSQQGGMGFASGGTEQFKWWEKITETGLPPHWSLLLFISPAVKLRRVALWVARLRNIALK